MEIKYAVLGPFMTNTYIAYAKESLDAIIIDPSFEPKDLIQTAVEDHLKVGGILLTHAHVDHIAGLAQVMKAFPDAKVYMHEKDLPFLGNPHLNLSDTLPEPVRYAKADVYVKAGDVITIKTLSLQVLETPGHTPGGISFYAPKDGVVFTGDTLFQGSVGRTDFPGGSMTTLIESIKTELLTLPEETVVLSGHGTPTTIGAEMQMNPFLGR